MADYTIPSAPVSTSPATTFELPNFVGELFSLIPAQTPFLSMAGGLTGGKSVSSKEFTWQVEDNEAAAANNSKLEGDDPTDENTIIRQEVKNVVEIHQEAVAISYTKQAAIGQLGAGGAGDTGAEYGIAAAPILGSQPVTGELPHQLALKINKIARDVEMSFLQGVYDYPADNVTERATRGILTAIDTHDTAFDTDLVTTFNNMLVGMYSDEMSIAPLINPVIFLNGASKVALSREYTNNLGLADRSRTIGGVNVETIITDFGTFGVVLDRYMPVDVVGLFDMSVVSPCFLPIAGKGHFFTEPLAKTGAYDRVQIYGEIGLEYGPEQYHGKLATA